MKAPPGPIQLIITELASTPLTVLTVQLITNGLPTIAPCMGPGGDMVIVGVGTVCRAIMTVTSTQQYSILTYLSHPVWY